MTIHRSAHLPEYILRNIAVSYTHLETQYHYALVYTDFADFRYINDILGHGFGDQILAKYGEILLKGLRNGEVCGRVNADNFVLLFRYQDKREIAQYKIFLKCLNL